MKEFSRREFLLLSGTIVAGSSLFGERIASSQGMTGKEARRPEPAEGALPQGKLPEFESWMLQSAF